MKNFPDSGVLISSRALRYRLLAAVVAFALPGAALAQAAGEPATGEPADELKEIVVIGSRLQQAAGDGGGGLGQEAAAVDPAVAVFVVKVEDALVDVDLGDRGEIRCELVGHGWSPAVFVRA